MRNSFTALLVAFTLRTACIRPSTAESPPVNGAQRADTANTRILSSRGRSLVGVWRVVRFCDVDSSGRETQPFGPRPLGYFIYTPSGELSIQVMRTPAMSRFAQDAAPTDAELRMLHDSYFGYFGTYTITSDSTVVHHVLGGTLPEYVGTEQPRVYSIWGAQGDSLTIGGVRARACRLLVRIA